ncbi:MAG: hypothetical protein HY023_06050 [Chloroflexi bacterium]|nr:hypothetical protein [Chloroflexota bacterium]
MTRLHLACYLSLAFVFALPACAGKGQVTTSATPPVESLNFDAETQSLIARAERVVFVVPFSHWDTDWHESFPAYVKRSDGNILAAVQMAKESPQFRYTFEQTLFVQHFWDTFPAYRADLKSLVQKQQLTFAWAGITQPETSLVAPAVQARNLQLGEQWIADTFGPEFVPHTAWQSDAFGNSAALPLFLSSFDIPYLFIGRWQGRCDPDYQDCTPLPHAFYWKTPASSARVLVAYLSYPTAWDAIHRLPDEGQQIIALRNVVEAQFKRTDSKYVFLPMGSDFIDPLPNLPALVEKWNAADRKTILVMADPATAFRYLAAQDMPEVTVDLNPVWQAFYATRPFAKIADKESEYFLTAADKFGLLLDAPESAAWQAAAVNAHYDNIGAVSFDSVWAETQRPRFEQTLDSAVADLSTTVTQIADGVPAPFIVFNPTSWPRSEVVELRGPLPALPAAAQRLDAKTVAFLAADVSAIGYTTPADAETKAEHPATVSERDGRVILNNGLVNVTLDPAHGGAFADLARTGGPELLAGYGDDVAYLDDSGDVYGAHFGAARARESDVTAKIDVLAEGPLIARAQIAFSLDDQPITKTVTLRADSPLIEISLEIAALPETTALVQTPTALRAQTRTDDLGFTAFEHPMDNQPIVPGDVTYRRKIFYPITYWSDVTSSDEGLALITHGLQGLGGTDALNLMLARDVTEDEEGVTDREVHTLRYAYLPHGPDNDPIWQAAYDFNQPLIPVWRAGGQTCVQIPFRGTTCQPTSDAASRPASMSLLSADSGLVADVYRQGGQLNALVLDYDPGIPAILRVPGSEKQIPLAGSAITVVPIELK